MNLVIGFKHPVLSFSNIIMIMIIIMAISEISYRITIFFATITMIKILVLSDDLGVRDGRRKEPRWDRQQAVWEADLRPGGPCHNHFTVLLKFNKSERRICYMLQIKPKYVVKGSMKKCHIQDQFHHIRVFGKLCGLIGHPTMCSSQLLAAFWQYVHHTQ